MKNEKRKMKKEDKLYYTQTHTVYSIQVILFSFLFILSSFLSCTSLVENIGKSLDGSKEKIISRYQSENDIEVLKVINKNKEESILITINKYPMLKFRTSLPDENGFINFTALEYFGSSIQGWNEYSFLMLGTGYLILEENAELGRISDIDHIQITSGRIHRFDTRITGEEALTALRNRNERILSLTEWMKTTEKKDNFESIEQFNDYWMPFIFPELTKKNKRPENWQYEGDKFVRGEDIRWNTGYSERVFPEELWPIRNTGTLLRDWEEALPWIYMEYHWDYIVELLKDTITLKKIK